MALGTKPTVEQAAKRSRRDTHDLETVAVHLDGATDDVGARR
jgi:hypothetical protein